MEATVTLVRKRRVLGAFLSLLGSLLFAVSGDSAAAAGGGVVRTDFDGAVDTALEGAVDGRGRIVVAGTSRGPDAGPPSISIARYSSGLRLDPEFGDGGRVQLALGDPVGRVAVDVDSQGRVIVAGATESDSPSIPFETFLARLLADGSLDPSFADAGIFRMEGGISDLVVDSQDRPTVTGLVNANGIRPAVLRLTTTGELDPSFSGDGVRTFTKSGFGPLVDTAIDGSGNLLLASGQRKKIRVTRIRADGRLDRGFGNRGRSVAFEGAGPGAVEIALDGGDIMLAASLRGGKVGIARLRGDGTPDRSFNRNGQRTLPINSTTDLVRQAFAGRGRMVVGTGRRLARLTGTGQLDRSFGKRGMKRSPVEVADLLTAPAGKVVVLGTDREDFALSVLPR